MADQEQFEQEPVHIPVETPPQRNWQSLVYPALVIGFVLVAGIIYLYQKPFAKNKTTDNQEVVAEDPDAWKIYTNDEFGFELTFVDDWKDYQSRSVVVSKKGGDSPDYQYTRINFAIPVDGNIIWDDSGPEYPLSIYIYPATAWTNLAEANKDEVNFITKNRDFAFAYTQWSKPIAGLEDKDLQIRKVASSLRLTKLPADNGTKWQVYTNDTSGFEFQYPNYTTAGSIAPNSSLGTYQEPVKGIYAGSYVLVPLDKPGLVKDANDIVDSAINTAKNPPQPAEEGGLAVSCTEEKYGNVDLKIKAVSCVGEGGPAFYAIIDGPKTDLFVDGYSGGFGGITPPKLKTEDLAAFFASFKYK